MFVLELLGTISLRSATRLIPVPAQQRRPLGLLAILGLGGRHGLPRDRIEAYFWPESSAALARHALDQTVYALRHALGSDVLLSTGRELRLNADLVQVDVWDFEGAIRAREWEAAVGRYKGTLLDGVHFADSRELESWIDSERSRLRADYQVAVESLADIAAKAGDHAQSVAWCRLLANSDPLSARATTRLMLALAAAGDRAGVVRHARLYQELVRQDLQMEPDSAIEALASRLSGAAVTESVRITAPRTPPVVAIALPAETPTPAPSERGFSDRERHDRPLAKPRRATRSRIAAVTLMSVLAVLLLAAVSVENWRGRDRRPSPAGNIGRRRQSVPLPAARVAYRRALAAWRDGSNAGLDTAVVYFRRATELDDEFAEAYAGLADAYVMLAYFGYRPGGAVLPAAKTAALRSLQLDSSLASARPALAYELSWERDFAGADAEYRKALEFDPTPAMAQAVAFDPTYVTAHQWYSILLMILSQQAEPGAEGRRVARRDPFSLRVPVVEVTFTKWITTYPALSGFTSYGPGTIGGEILSRIDDGDFTHLVARYEITDPGGAHAFKAVIQGKANNLTGKYDLNGIITWGWMTGAHVRATFQRMTPCEFGRLNLCYQGTIQIQPS